MMESFNSKGFLLEGYGLSECSAVLTVNRLDEPHKGDGRPLPGVEVMIINQDTHQPLPFGELGLIVARGNTVFSGYINPDIESPFIEVQGKTWFVTGDLGYMTDQGYLTVTDRMRRHIRIGGETVGLQAMEEVLWQMADEKGWETGDEGATMAVCSEERRGKKPKIHLFTRFDTDVIEVNEALRDAGLSPLARVVSVTKVSEIPIMGTGQVNYRRLQDSILHGTPID